MKVLALLSVLAVSQGFSAPKTSSRTTTTTTWLAAEGGSNRRSFMGNAAAAVVGGALLSGSQSAGAMPQEDFSNDFIQTLKSRSDAKREEYTKQAADGKISWEKMDKAKFSQQYKRPTFIGVQRSDETFKMVTPEQLEALKKDGKIVEIYLTKVNKQGEVVPDYSRGSVFKFTDSYVENPVPPPAPVVEVVEVASEPSVSE